MIGFKFGSGWQSMVTLNTEEFLIIFWSVLREGKEGGRKVDKERSTEHGPWLNCLILCYYSIYPSQTGGILNDRIPRLNDSSFMY